MVESSASSTPATYGVRFRWHHLVHQPQDRSHRRACWPVAAIKTVLAHDARQEQHRLPAALPKVPVHRTTDAHQGRTMRIRRRHAPGRMTERGCEAKPVSGVDDLPGTTVRVTVEEVRDRL